MFLFVHGNFSSLSSTNKWDSFALRKVTQIKDPLEWQPMRCKRLLFGENIASHIQPSTEVLFNLCLGGWIAANALIIH